MVFYLLELQAFQRSRDSGLGGEEVEGSTFSAAARVSHWWNSLSVINDIRTRMLTTPSSFQQISMN